MPYLDSKIDKHYKNCINPVGKRLYIRDYDDKGKQTYVPWGLTCTSCGVVVKEKQKYQRGLTPKQLRKMELEKELEGSNYAKTMEKLTGRPYNSQDHLERAQQRKIRHKLERVKRRKLRNGQEPITPFEAGLRRRVKDLKHFYEFASWYADGDNKEIKDIWNQNLVEQFLYVSPRPTISELKKVYYLFGPDGNASTIAVDLQSKFRYVGFVPNPERPGWMKRDKDAYIELLKSEAKKRMELMQQIIKSREGTKEIK